MSKGRSTDTSGTIDPALKPILTQSANNIMDAQNRNPITDYSDSTQKQVAGLSDMQKLAGGKIQEMNQPKMGDYLALQNIMQAKDLAGRTPSTGTGNLYKPTMNDFRGALQSYGGTWQPQTPNASSNWTGASVLGPQQLPPGTGPRPAPPQGTPAPNHPPPPLAT